VQNFVKSCERFHTEQQPLNQAETVLTGFSLRIIQRITTNVTPSP
jgi:hypothetical protein